MSTFWKPSCQNELYHFGVKGMKWGVRKDRSSSETFLKNLDEKKANNISEFPIRKSLITRKNVRDKRQYRKQKRFESYLDKNLTFSDDYVKAIKEHEKFVKQTKRDTYGELYSKSARTRASQLAKKVDKEAYKLLGLDEKKLTPLARLYIAEAVNETYRRRTA